MNEVLAGKYPKRFIVGARVSTDEQSKKGVSISHQLEVGRDKVAELGGVVVGHCVEAGVSGALYESRADLQKVLTQIEGGQADALVWYDLSRMSRDIEHIHAIQRRVKLAGGEVHFCTAEYSDDADGFLHRGISGVVHQHQRLKTRELSMANRRKVVASGRQTQRSVSPLGYHIVSRLDVIRGTHTTDQLGHYEIVPDHAPIAREIFECYAAGESSRAICRKLQARGLPAPSGKPSSIWRPTTIKAILENHAYYGNATWGKTRTVADESRLRKNFKRPWKRQRVPQEKWDFIPCPPIVSKELWDACNERRKIARQTSSGAPARKYMLSGLVRCPKCGRNFRSNAHKYGAGKRVLMHCPEAWPALTAGREVCFPRHVWADEIESQVLEVIVSIVTQPETLEQVYQQHQQQARNSFSDDACEKLKRDLAALERKMQAAVEAQVEAKINGVDATVYERILQETSSQRQTLRDQIARFDTMRARSKSRGTTRDKASFFAQIGHDVNDALRSRDVPSDAKQKMLSRLVESITPLGNGKSGIRIVFRAGVFEPNQRWAWANGEWSIEETGR